MIYFILRGVFFLLLISLPLIHPAIIVAYDRFWGLSLFAMVPLGMAAGVAFPAKNLSLPTQGGVLAAVPIILSMAVLGLPWTFGGFKAAPLLSAGIFYLSFGLTWFLYYRKSLWAGILEPFFMALLTFRLLEYFQGGMELTGSQNLLPSLFFFLTIFLFLGQSLVTTLWIGRDKEGFRRPDILAVVGSVVLVLGVSFFAVQPNSIIYELVQNSNYFKAEPEPFNMEEGELFENEGAQGEMDPADGESELFTQEAEGFESMMDDPGKQYPVMLVHADRPTLYLSGEYFGEFDPELGFLYSEDEPLNDYKRRRFVEIYEKPVPKDNFRAPVTYDIYSLFGEKYLPFSPKEIEPTVFRGEYHPFNYIHKGESYVSFLGPADFDQIRELNDQERALMADYLDVSLPEEERQIFQDYLDEVLSGGEDSLGERLRLILMGYRTFQYQLGFDENMTIRKISDFITQTRTGDCTEFSNATALLARMAGVPSRVVTGYLASPGLQTLAHQQGTYELQQRIPALQDIPLHEIIMVTTSHRHSWTQVWLPEAGWVDLETTSTALPPEGSLDPNNLDLVIPQIQPEREERETFAIPWALLLNFTLLAVGGSILGLYLIVAIKYLALHIMSRGKDQKSAIALYRLLLFELARDGYPVKEPHETAEDYAQRVLGIEDFARQYNRIRYRSAVNPQEVAELRKRYQFALADTRVPGFWPTVKRFFRIKGLNL
jgi:transglutaminase-like putative cysteine protease